MTEEEKELWSVLLYRIDEEGFDYCFNGYSSWVEIKDERFHKLRLEYLESVKSMKEYINLKYKESEL